MDIPSELIQLLRKKPRTAVLTGAGISAESGIPTFREAQTGLWARYQPEDLATPAAFERSPRLVWEWYAWRRELVAKASPNAGHYALAALESRLDEYCLITQNVDGLHARAGSRCVLELHGSLQRVKCSRCHAATDGEDIPDWQTIAAAHPEEIPPRCPSCGAALRPDVVWFGESLPGAAFQAAWQAAETCQMFLSIGTSALVQPAASLPLIALQQGAVVVEINPSATPLTPQVTYSLMGPSGAVLPDLVNQAFPAVAGTSLQN